MDSGRENQGAEDGKCCYDIAKYWTRKNLLEKQQAQGRLAQRGMRQLEGPQTVKAGSTPAPSTNERRERGH